MVTNDDGIDSAGLHALVTALSEVGEVTVVAPEDEHSGASASLGDLGRRPEARIASVEGAVAAYAVNGPPALCGALVVNGVFGDLPDLVVSGINAGVNVGWSFIHSGTVGAARTTHQGGVASIAVSQAVPGWRADEQGRMDLVAEIPWELGAELTAVVADAMVASLPYSEDRRPLVNLNVPLGGSVEDLSGWRSTTVSQVAASERLGGHEEVPGRVDRIRATMRWTDRDEPVDGTDAQAVKSGAVSVSWMQGHPVLLERAEVPSSVADALDEVLGA